MSSLALKFILYLTSLKMSKEFYAFPNQQADQSVIKILENVFSKIMEQA